MSNLMEMLNDAETAIKVTRLLSSMSVDDMQTTISDGMNILRILLALPYGATTKQIAALNMREDENYTQAIINIFIRGGLIESTAERGQTIYKLKGGSV